MASSMSQVHHYLISLCNAIVCKYQISQSLYSTTVYVVHRGLLNRVNKLKDLGKEIEVAQYHIKNIHKI